ncbi:MAG: hypothetical protein ACXU86_11060 [Archangium sp.]
MKRVIFGLTVSSSWGNGHAPLWRGLIAALTARGHRVVFFERDQPFYASHRDLLELPAGAALTGLERLFGARHTAPLYGSVDPRVHFPVPAREHYRGDLSLLGTRA